MATKHKMLPITRDPQVIRTDFSDDDAWKSMCEDLLETDLDHDPEVEMFSDLDFEGLGAETLLKRIPPKYNQAVLLIFDKMTCTHAEAPLLLVGLLGEEKGRTFRIIPTQVGIVSVNLTIANTDFEDFAKDVGSDGIYRGLE